MKIIGYDIEFDMLHDRWMSVKIFI